MGTRNAARCTGPPYLRSLSAAASHQIKASTVKPGTQSDRRSSIALYENFIV